MSSSRAPGRAKRTNPSVALRVRRHQRVRAKVSGTPARPRLSVSRSARHITAQIIDDTRGVTLAAAGTLDKDLRSELGAGGGGNLAGAAAAGRLLATRAKAAGVTSVVFDRGGFAYHGRVAALADAARSQGLEF